MYSTYKEAKSVVAERFSRTLKNKIYKYMTSIWKNVKYCVFNYIVDKYNSTYKTIKVKPGDVKSGNYIQCHVNSNYKDLNLKLVIM